MGELAEAVEEVTSELPKRSSVPIALAIPLALALLTACGAWYGQKARVDSLESRVEHIERVGCAVEGKLGLEDVECERLMQQELASRPTIHSKREP